MHLSFFIPDLRGGGAQHMTVNLANEFARRGHSVDLLLVNRAGPYGDKIAENVRIVDFNRKRILNSFFALRRYLKKERPDMIISALVPANILLLAARRFCRSCHAKIIVTERNYFSLRSTDKQGILSRFLPALVRFFYPCADKVIGISRGVAEDIKAVARLPGKQVTWAHNPVVTNHTLSLLEEDVDEPWFAKESAPVIVASGRLVPQKDYEVMLKAFAAMKTQARLLILGEGPLRDDIALLSEKLGVSERIYMKGFVDNPLAYMKKCDLFVLSSRWEGFGNVLVEALLCGLPVVSTDCKAGPAEILDDGKYGTLVPVGNAEALAQAMDAALSEKTEPAQQKQRAMDFTVENSADRYEEIIKEVAGAGG